LGILDKPPQPPNDTLSIGVSELDNIQAGAIPMTVDEELNIGWKQRGLG
jgi:hypothetical protein